MKVFALHCGTLTAPMAAFVEGEAGEATVPVPAYLIDHPKGLVVVDTGMPPLMRSDPAKAVGGFLASVFMPRYAPGQGLTEQIEIAGYDPAHVTEIVNTHLHFDHGGGNALLPNARVVVQKRELDAAAAEKAAADGSYVMRHALDGRDVLGVDGTHDLFGDGRIVLMPTYGHTAGHQSVKLACEGGETVLAGDCCYFHRTLTDGKLPGFAHDADGQRAAIARLKAMQDRGVRIIPGHDAGVLASLKAAPEPFLSD
jgi:glyoxylase-like metal-dependent hydrolase (beta-lactamase superfamily II)